LKTMISVGLNNRQDGFHCGVEAARSALSRFDNKQPTLALLFTSHQHPDRVLKGVNHVLENIPLIGATSAGEYTAEGYVEDGAGVMLIASEDLRFYPLAHRRHWFKRGKLLDRLFGTSEAGLGSDYHYRTLMLFPEDQSVNLDQLVMRAMKETGMLYDILGGASPTMADPPRTPAVFSDHQMIRTGLTGVEILSRVPSGLALANGWIPMSVVHRVTQTDRGRIAKIDGRPAREVYEDFLRVQGYALDKDLPQHLLLKHPIGICTDQPSKVSVVMGFDSSGALKTASPPPSHSLIQILGTKTESMVAAAEHVVSKAAVGLRQHPAGLLFIDCMSTAMVLEEAHQQQRQAVINAVGNRPFLGFCSHGVLARLQGQITGHYECSVAAWMLPE
jgi:hypothetical protein